VCRSALWDVAAGVICAAPMMNDWCRAQVVESYPDTDEYDVKLVDYGGYLHLPGTSLRQIRYVQFFPVSVCFKDSVVCLKWISTFLTSVRNYCNLLPLYTVEISIILAIVWLLFVIYSIIHEHNLINLICLVS